MNESTFITSCGRVQTSISEIGEKYNSSTIKMAQSHVFLSNYHFLMIWDADFEDFHFFMIFRVFRDFFMNLQYFWKILACKFEDFFNFRFLRKFLSFVLPTENLLFLEIFRRFETHKIRSVYCKNDFQKNWKSLLQCEFDDFDDFL